MNTTREDERARASVDGSIDLRYLRYALLAAELGSFRKAADALEISQSTLTRRIQSLETGLHFPLFERSRGGVRATWAGIRFMREASLATTAIRGTLNEIALARRGVIGALRIGLTISFGGGPVADLLDKYRQQFRQVHVILEERTTDAIAAGLLSGRIDVGFHPSGRCISGCRTRPLWKEAIYAALPGAHRLAGVREVGWDDLRHELFLVMAEGTGPDVRDYIIARLSSPGFRPRIAVQYVGHGNLLNMVAQGFGVTLVTETVSRANHAGISFRPIASDDAEVSFSVSWPEKNENPTMAGFLKLICASNVDGAQQERNKTLCDLRKGTGP